MPNLGAGIYLLILWEIFWKGVGLWKSAKKGDLIWFLAIFLINFFGIIPLFYLWKTKQLDGVIKDFQNFFKSLFLRFQKK
ncbi:MAG: hypothetical protein ACD_38C00204G0002 [uncultured bacterium]|uniref:DUF5652 domain-containing protein n=1 Tax=Candidatus Daviesbacteria bacterium GW2011_GWC2_40_12 TaxID=1618431 RepID=A0A0G0T3E3_9BACT|nr:MAG: hypothetical protein ACD_38C00204G0002 [uncultured bacterium]KKQ84903.1 MAG: hypothetical protein UT04_C0010G0015 [Candidatus Daviesbacteria bacterium GW2011_GWF2_38_7]KKR16279.1 MAG: hypothetical protein UT45_C0007G0036 [Candidatus Daviesbacteria bacterium GW2011_GWA2_39_33]KKR41605.1 MAG: hypothetical protein UT77_C0009G0063 [Candidatus Daviesbacteria bacterium GW2011_GWC2_40_12]